MDPITNLLSAASFNEVQIMVSRMIDFLKKKSITGLYTTLTGSEFQESPGEAGVSSIMDTWIVLRNLEMNGERTRLLNIWNSRGMAHDSKVREFLLTDRGVELVDVYAGPSGILTGTARIEQASDQGRPINIVLTDIRNSTLDGIQATRLIKEQFPDIAILVLTENLNDFYVIDAIHAGAGGYIFLKDISPEVLLQSIHRAVEGRMQMDTAVLRSAVDALLQNGRGTIAEHTAESAHLTKREADVLRLLGNGASNRIIAETLGVTIDTVKKHARNVIDKLQARSRTHAAIIAAQAGIVGNPVTPVVEAQSEPGSVT